MDANIDLLVREETTYGINLDLIVHVHVALGEERSVSKLES
jgi:hypothetical protein